MLDRSLGYYACVLCISHASACSSSHESDAPLDATRPYTPDAESNATDAFVPATLDAGVDAAPRDAGIKQPIAPRLPAPCAAPLPTGFCLVSESGDYIGQGKTYEASGSASVMFDSDRAKMISGRIVDDDGSTFFNYSFAAKSGEPLLPGLYDPASIYSPLMASPATLDVHTTERNCSTSKGKFSIEELGLEPDGVTRFSVTFEQRCDGSNAALRGVINYNARGKPDATPSAERTIALDGKVFRVAYDATAHVAYGIDATNRKIARIDLESGQATYKSVTQVPNDVCIDRARGRLFIVNKGSSIVSEHKLEDLSLARELSWTPIDWGSGETHFHIYCGADGLYLVDGAWAPGLHTIANLDAETPVTTDQTMKVSSVGALVRNSAGSDFYIWEQFGWNAGSLGTSVRRFSSADLSMVDQTTLMSGEGFSRDPLDVPVLLDETRNLIFNKNRVFDARNLERLVFTLPGEASYLGAAENTYALDPAHGLFATRNFVYSIEGYEVLSPTLTDTADQMFFDRDALLWLVDVSTGSLRAQRIER